MTRDPDYTLDACSLQSHEERALRCALDDLKRYAPTGSYLACCSHDQADGACVHVITLLHDIYDSAKANHHTNQPRTLTLKPTDGGDPR
jgi:hypothetical protein